MWEVEKGTDHKESYINYGFLRDWRGESAASKWDKLERVSKIGFG
jgi:hypothetical protein